MTPTAIERRRTGMRLTAATVAAALFLIGAAGPAVAGPPPSPAPPGAFVQTGLQDTTARKPVPKPPVDRTPATAGPRPALEPGSLTAEECKAQTAAQVTPGNTGGWYQDRLTWCAWGDFFAIGTDVRTGEIVATVSFEFVVIGFGNNGARQFDYLVQLDDIITDGNLPWETTRIEAGFQECKDPQPSTQCSTFSRSLSPSDWRFVNAYAVTFTSSEIAGGGDQIEGHVTTARLAFDTPANPEWVWQDGVVVAGTPERYDSATYSGRARGAVFPTAPLVFRVDGRDPLQDESARHIFDAIHRPSRTLPSWNGKSVPSRLTRMRSDADNLANRNYSRGKCATFYGEWPGQIQNCDEYPFAATYEGSLTGQQRNGGLERYSVRIIDADDNQYVGQSMLQINFFQQWRVLDGEQFDVVVDGIS
jgi:hypothetical protein